MAGRKGIEGASLLASRAKEKRGGNAPQPDSLDRNAPDALALWRDKYFESLKARNYAEGTIEGRQDALKMFLLWANERDLKRASQITRPMCLAVRLRAICCATHAPRTCLKEGLTFVTSSNCSGTKSWRQRLFTPSCCPLHRQSCGSACRLAANRQLHQSRSICMAQTFVA
jgi:hypothetical protein